MPKFSRLRSDGFIVPFHENHDPKYYDFFEAAEAPHDPQWISEPDPETIQVRRPRRNAAASTPAEGDAE